MHSIQHLGPRKIFGFGDFFITETVLYFWIIMAVMITFAYFATRKLEEKPKGIQLVAEYIVEFIYKFTEGAMGKHNSNFSPYIGTLFIFLILGNSLGLWGLRPVTADVNTTFALAGITFFLVHYNSIKAKGIGGYLRHMSAPYPFMLPINIVGELAFPISLSFRLFGNIAGGMIIMALIFTGLESVSESLRMGIPFLEFLIPLPANLFFDIFEPILQAFVFTMLTMVFISLNNMTHGDHS
jgi:F-type H+-transporting ATPase subunit a